jgi:DNA-binding NtrC family response regulator
VLTNETAITAPALRAWLGEAVSPLVNAGASLADSADLETMERRMIEATLEKFAGHRGKTAEALGIGVRTLANKMRAYGYGPHDRTFARS